MKDNGKSPRGEQSKPSGSISQIHKLKYKHYITL